MTQSWQKEYQKQYQAKALQTISCADLEGPPPEREWLEQDWIPRNTVGLLTSMGGDGKSLVCTAAGFHWAQGESYLSAGKIAPQNVYIISCEDNLHELHRRYAALRARYPGADLGLIHKNLHFCDRVSEDNVLAVADGNVIVWTNFYDDLVQTIKEREIDVLIVDNVAQTFAGNENDRAQVTQFVNGVHGVFKKTGREGVTILVAHPGKAALSEYSGSTAWSNAVRWRIWLSRTQLDDNGKPIENPDQDENARFISLRKSNQSVQQILELEWSDWVIAPKTNFAGEVYTQRVRARELPEWILQRVWILKEKFGVEMISPSNYAAKNNLRGLLLANSLPCNYKSNQIAACISKQLLTGELVLVELPKIQNYKERKTVDLPEETRLRLASEFQLGKFK